MNQKQLPTRPEGPEILALWAEDTQREIDQIINEMLPLQKQLEAAREKLDLVKRLIHLASPERQSADNLLLSTNANALPEIEDHIEGILQKASKPLHIREIREQLIKLGVPLPGRGDEANIILRIRRDSSRFVRTERGTYALTIWNLPTYSPPPHKRTIRKQRKLRK